MMFPIFDLNEAAHRRCQRWGDIFGAAPTSRTTGPRWCCPLFNRRLTVFDWNVGLDKFKELLASKHESALGPDGLPKKKFLFAAYQAILQGAALPAGFDTSRTVFIPKSAEVDA